MLCHTTPSDVLGLHPPAPRAGAGNRFSGRRGASTSSRRPGFSAPDGAQPLSIRTASPDRVRRRSPAWLGWASLTGRPEICRGWGADSSRREKRTCLPDTAGFGDVVLCFAGMLPQGRAGASSARGPAARRACRAKATARAPGRPLCFVAGLVRGRGGGGARMKAKPLDERGATGSSDVRWMRRVPDQPYIRSGRRSRGFCYLRAAVRWMATRARDHGGDTRRRKVPFPHGYGCEPPSGVLLHGTAGQPENLLALSTRPIRPSCTPPRPTASSLRRPIRSPIPLRWPTEQPPAARMSLRAAPGFTLAEPRGGRGGGCRVWRRPEISGVPARPCVKFTVRPRSACRLQGARGRRVRVCHGHGTPRSRPASPWRRPDVGDRKPRAKLLA
ncbi:uncharacterized protein LOC125520994 [Triticum urartu]|uniref:uncharacterized protein LOC125520994 n=1 Tax=Triticum urartu TaxID=4572 RepID=UPI00204454B4|nr:uncharacterized protein LOC125520994 [Triticum urartu]XP_048541989.1 uncharacterized protein LOC125520994 [Triticum urartu]